MLTARPNSPHRRTALPVVLVLPACVLLGLAGCVPPPAPVQPGYAPAYGGYPAYPRYTAPPPRPFPPPSPETDFSEPVPPPAPVQETPVTPPPSPDAAAPAAPDANAVPTKPPEAADPADTQRFQQLKSSLEGQSAGQNTGQSAVQNAAQPVPAPATPSGCTTVHTRAGFHDHYGGLNSSGDVLPTCQQP